MDLRDMYMYMYVQKNVDIYANEDESDVGGREAATQRARAKANT
jgi:hypothetical protein